MLFSSLNGIRHVRRLFRFMTWPSPAFCSARAYSLRYSPWCRVHRIDDEGMEALAGLVGKNANIASLILSNNCISDKGLKTLVHALENGSGSGLQQLVLSCNPQVTDESILALSGYLRSNQTLVSACRHRISFGHTVCSFGHTEFKLHFSGRLRPHSLWEKGRCVHPVTF